MAILNRATILGCLPALACLGVMTPANAETFPYQNAGSENPQVYTFTAPRAGEIRAYVYATASVNFTDTLGLRVNGVDTMKSGPTNKDAAGTYADLGFAEKGATLTFLLNVVGLGNQLYSSDPTQNLGGTNLLYSTPFSGGNGLPAGTYLGWEDLNPANNPPKFTSDFNYTDAQFVFTLVPAVPLPGAAPLFGAALATCGLLGFLKRRPTSASA